jgi:hypothetical protein
MKLVRKLEPTYPEWEPRHTSCHWYGRRGIPTEEKSFLRQHAEDPAQKKHDKIFIPRKRADMVRRLGTGPGLILERECAKDEQGDSDAERTADREQTNQMKAP